MKQFVLLAFMIGGLTSCSKEIIEQKCDKQDITKHACEVLPNLELSKAAHIAEIVILAYSFQKALPNSLQDVQEIDTQLEDYQSNTTNSSDEIEQLAQLYAREDLVKNQKIAYLTYDFNKRMLHTFKSLLAEYAISLDPLEHADDKDDAQCSACIEIIMHYYTESVKSGTDLALVEIKPKM